MEELHAERARRGAFGGWPAQAGFRLVDRDLAILFSVGKLKVATRRQLERLHFGSPHTCRDRLAKIKEAGLLRVAVRQLHEDNYYLLTERGRAAVLKGTGVSAREVTVSRGLPKQLDHLRAINDVRVELVAALRDWRELRLAFFHPSWELQRKANPVLFGLVPDALIGIEAERGTQIIALEIDLGTEAPSYVARRKLAAYDQLIATGVGVYGYVPDVIALLAPGYRRLRCLVNAANAARVGERTMLGNLDDRQAQSLLAPRFAPVAALLGCKGDAAAERLHCPLFDQMVSPTDRCR